MFFLLWSSAGVGRTETIFFMLWKRLEKTGKDWKRLEKTGISGKDWKS
jgi:hypothetical protein